MLLDAMPHTATARRRKRASDGMLGFTDDFPEVLFTGRSCWRQPANDQEVHYWDQRSILVTNKVFFSTDPALKETDVIEITNPQGGTDRFEVVNGATPDSSAGLGVVWRVMVRRLEEGMS